MMTIPDVMAVPLYTDPNGKIRIGKTRVLLELVIHAYWQGETAESIVESYPTLKLADVYAVFAYYLENHTEVDAYVREAEKRVEQIQQQVEAAYAPETIALRARLRALRESGSADPS